MAKKNTLDDLNEFLKETKSSEEQPAKANSKEEFLAKEPKQLVEVKKVGETNKTPVKKTPSRKPSAKKTVSKPKATAKSKTTTARKNTSKATATKKVSEALILTQLDALAKQEDKTMREVWAGIAKKVGAEFPQSSESLIDEGVDILVDLAMAPMNFLVSVSDRINKML
ncbi:hypothetical protein [Microscilla marina]|uniref:Uncharacterized protein n=1 Tax=Microscilla marina ATCC 23134 TaxID=313606 RepID=A1ZZU4_MICM2|nr:hypothetical protein [Microscilla marina]EAY24105.1 hypothetical protein M23134_02481 [Microscilla marina ATCC 23134]